MAALNYSQLEFISSEMASLTRAGIPLPEGLRQLAAHAETSAHRGLYQQLAVAMEQGQGLADALAQAGAPPEFIAALRCAEISGDMADVLEFAIEHCRRVDFFYGKLANIVLYPVLVACIALIIIGGLLAVVIPKFVAIFNELGAELPVPTQFFVDLGYALHGWFGMAVVVLAVLVLAWACSPWFIRTMPFILQRLPFFRGLLLISDMAMLMRFFERMLRRGVPLPVVLRASSLAVWSDRLRLRLGIMARQAEQGSPVFAALEGVVPPLPAHLLRQAEERGDLVESFNGVARYCEDRFSLRAEIQLRRLEPLIIVGTGFIMACILISLYLPLFSIPKLVK